MITSHQRGHEIYFDGINWRYSDTGQIADDTRPCRRCGCVPTQDGRDACIGNINGAKSVCCGHGVEKPYIIWKEE